LVTLFLDLQLDDGLEFSFTDKRRFARVRLFEDPETVPPISELGPDALFEPMSVDNFLDSLGRKKIGIKALLLDQVISIQPILACLNKKVLPALYTLHLLHLL